MTDATGVVFDASALVAYARDEPGGRVVAERLRTSSRVLISAVNWAEAAGKLREYGMTPAILRQALAAVNAQIVPFGEADANAVGQLTPRLRLLGLSLGDRACIALALLTNATAVTADQSWGRAGLASLVVELIR